MARILVVEDEPDLRLVLQFNLTENGHEVFVAETGAQGLRLARENKPDLILLDLMLPDIGGLDVCRQLKMGSQAIRTAVLMLTARGEEVDRVVGFQSGADDYVVKPFSVRELMLRVDAILRRTAGVEKKSEAPIEFGVLSIDRTAHRVWVAREEIELTALELKLLLTLFDRRNRVQSRTELLEVVWEIRADVTTRTVDTHVKRLREKLKGARVYIETVRGVGYRFVDNADEAGS
jgi:two-component system phosphate regulon response regulator PhoB